MTTSEQYYEHITVARHRNLRSALSSEFATWLRVVLIPFMVVVLVLVLTGRQIESYIYGVFPALLLLAFILACVSFVSTPGRVYVGEQAVAVVNIWSCFRRSDVRRWILPLDFQSSETTFQVFLGYGPVRFKEKHWEEYPRMKAHIESVYKVSIGRGRESND